MSLFDDDQIRAALARRSRAELTEVERADILRAARLQALQPRRRLIPRLAGWLAATAAVAVLVVIAVPVLLSSPVPASASSSPPTGLHSPTPSMTPVAVALASSSAIASRLDSPTPSVPPVHVANGTTLTLTVAIDGKQVGIAQAGQVVAFDPSPYAEPWTVTVSTASGRELVELKYQASQIVSTANSEQGVAKRLDLSCGRLDVYAGPPLLGPGPPSSFPPHDCDDGTGAVPQVYVSNATTLKLTVSINGEPKGTSEPGAIDLFDPGGLAAPWSVTLTTESGRVLMDMTYQLSDIGTNAGGTNPETGAFVGQRLDLSCGRLDVSVGGIILGPGVPPDASFAPGDCDP